MIEIGFVALHRAMPLRVHCAGGGNNALAPKVYSTAGRARHAITCSGLSRRTTTVRRVFATLRPSDDDTLIGFVIIRDGKLVRQRSGSNTFSRLYGHFGFAQRTSKIFAAKVHFAVIR
jgi:hypothetical protein